MTEQEQQKIVQELRSLADVLENSNRIYSFHNHNKAIIDEKILYGDCEGDVRHTQTKDTGKRTVTVEVTYLTDYRSKP